MASTTTSANSSIIGAGAGVTSNQEEENTIKKIINKRRTAKVEEGLSRALSLPEIIPIYFYFGHGRDNCDEKGNIIEKKVFRGNIYVTITECGLTTPHIESPLEKLLGAVSDNEGFIPEIYKELETKLRHIYYPGYGKQFATIIGVDEKDVHVKLPGTTYNESNFNPHSYWNNNFHFVAAHSGLIERNNFIKNKYKYIPEYVIKKFTLEEVGITADTTIPKSEFFSTLLINIDTKYTRYGDKYKNMIKRYTEEKLSEPQTKVKFEEMFAEKTVLDYNDMNNFLDKHYYTIPKERIVTNFTGSVFPTQQEVRKMLEEYPNDVLTLTEYQRFSDYMPRKTNTELMSRFPGIHFNLVCRVLSERCASKLATHRSKSVERNRTRRTVTQQKAPSTNVVLKSIANYTSTEPERLNTILKQLEYIKHNNKNSISTIRNKLEEFFVLLIKYDLDMIDPTNAESFSTLFKKIERMKNIFHYYDKMIYSPNLRREMDEKLFEVHSKGKLTDRQLLSLYYTINSHEGELFSGEDQIPISRMYIDSIVEKMLITIQGLSSPAYISSVLTLLKKIMEKAIPYSREEFSKDKINMYYTYRNIQETINTMIQRQPAYEQQIRDIQKIIEEIFQKNNQDLFEEAKEKVIQDELKRKRGLELHDQEIRRIREARQAEEARKAEEARQAEEARKAEETRRVEEARILQVVLTKMNAVLKKTYKSPHDKQVAIYNTLLTLKDQLGILRDKSEVLTLLEAGGIFKGKAPVIGKIKTLLSVTAGGRRTRKQKRSKKQSNKTRKQ